MNAMTGFPHQIHWGPHDLAAAVPLKLSELYGFDLRRDGPAPGCANGEVRRTRDARRGYLPAAALPALFRID